MGFRFLSVAIIGVLCAGHFALAQTAPATQPSVADTLPPGWQEIDQRLVFFTVQLASTETSLEAVKKVLDSREGFVFRIHQQAQNPDGCL